MEGLTIVRSIAAVSIAVTILYSQATIALAEHNDFDDDLFAEMPVVLTATRLSQPLNEAPISTSIIDEEMITASGAQNIQDLFRLVPGFQVFYSNNNQVGVTAHGLDEHSSRRMQVLVNGRSIYLPTTGGVPWGDLPITIDDIKHIEVVRGPNAATHGANAFLGVINIITKHSTEDYGTRLKVGGGYNGQGKIDIRHGGSYGDLDYRIGISGHSDDGFINHNDGRETAVLSGRIDYQATANDILFLEAGYSKGIRKDGRPDNELNNPHRLNAYYNFQQLEWNHTFSNENFLKTQFSHQYHEIDNNYRTEGVAFLNPPGAWIPVFSFIDFDYFGHRYDMELAQHLSLTEQTQIVWGAGARHDQVKSAGYLGTGDTLDNTTYKLFGNIESHLTERLVVNAGVMHENNESAGSEYSPRLGLLYHLSPNSSFRTSFSKASRNPVLYEEHANAVIRACTIANPLLCGDLPIVQSTGSIKPEIIRMAEAGWHYNNRASGIQFDIRYFHQGMRRMIGTDNSIYQNLDQTTTEGVELETDYKPFKRTRLHLSYARAITESTDNSDDGIEDATPTNSYSLLLIQTLPYGLSISGNYYYMDQIRGLGTGDDTGPIDRLDLRLVKTTSSSTGKSEINLIIQNVMDDEYAEYDRQNLFERRIYMELNHHF